MGARVARPDVDARLEVVTQPGVAPQDFYGTTIFPTEARIRGHWVRAQRQRMDAVLVVDGPPDAPRVTCRLLRDLRVGDRVVSGIEGVRTHPTHVRPSGSAFEFMAAGVSSERRVEVAVERIAWEMRRIRERGGKIAVVAGPVVIHTGGGPHLARLVRDGYVQALLGGNGFAVHDLEQSLFGTSLGVDLRPAVVTKLADRGSVESTGIVTDVGLFLNLLARSLGTDASGDEARGGEDGTTPSGRSL